MLKAFSLQVAIDRLVANAAYKESQGLPGSKIDMDLAMLLDGMTQDDAEHYLRKIGKRWYGEIKELPLMRKR